MCFSFRKSLKIRLWNLYLHTRPFWRFLLCGVAHALSIAHHVKFLQVAIEHRTMYQKLHPKSHRFHSFGEFLFFSNTTHDSVRLTVSFIMNPPVLLKIPNFSSWAVDGFTALLKNRPQAGRLFVARNGQVEHASLGLRTWCHVWLTKFKKKDLCQSIKGYQRCVLATFEIWLFIYLCYLETNCLKTLAPQQNGSHHSNLYLPPETRFRIGRGFLTVHPWPAYPPSKWYDSPWDSDQRLVSTGAVPAAICNATQRNDPHLPKSFSSEWKSKPKITWATGEKNEGIPGCICSVPGSWHFHGFMKIIPHITGYFFFHPRKTRGPVFSLLAWSQGILKKTSPPFDRMEMLWLLW